jgi:hypothetical protein
MNSTPSRAISLVVSPRTLAAMLVACVLIPNGGRAFGQANNIVQTMIPAFYQHQGDNGGTLAVPAPLSVTPSAAGIWKPDLGWCRYVSYMDTLYPWEALTVGGVRPYDNNNVWLFGTPGAPGTNPNVGTKLTGNASWMDAADDTVIPQVKAAGDLNAYLKQQKVDVGNLGLLGLLDTQYRTLKAGDIVGKPAGQVQVMTIDGWKDITANTFDLYQQLTSTGANLPAALQPLAAITTSFRINYDGANTRATTGFWWGFHQLSGAGVGGANTIQYSDPDAIPINAGNRNGGYGVGANLAAGQAAVTANQYNVIQKAGAPPLPGNGAYTTNNLYSTMQVNPLGQITGGNGPYASGLNGAAAPVSRITNIEAVSQPAAQLANIVVGPVFDTVKFLFSGNFGGDITKLEVFTNAPLYTANLGLSETDPNWSISQVMNDPFGNSWANTNGGILLSEGAGGADLIENGPNYNFTEDTTGPVTGWTVFAYDQADGYWLTQTYGTADAIGGDQQVQVPEPCSCMLMATGFLGVALVTRHPSRLRA